MSTGTVMKIGVLQDLTSINKSQLKKKKEKKKEKKKLIYEKLLFQECEIKYPPSRSGRNGLRA